jgi:hypothetical protein
MYFTYCIVIALCVDLSYSFSTIAQSVKDANTIVDHTIKNYIKDDVMPLPDVEKVVEESDVEHKFNTTVRLTNGKLIGLKSAKRIADCQVLSVTRITCPLSADVIAKYENHTPVRGSVNFALIITLDENERIVKTETTESIFVEKDGVVFYSIFSKIGKFVKNELKHHAGQIIGKVVGIAVKVGVTAITDNPVLGNIAGSIVGKVVGNKVNSAINPNKGQPNTGQSKPSQPKPSQPKPAPPKSSQPKPAQPKPSQPKPAPPKPSQPKPAQPKPSQPKPAPPKSSQPKPAQPKPSQPKPAKPNPSQPKAVQPKPGQPNPGNANHGAGHY